MSVIKCITYAGVHTEYTHVYKYSYSYKPSE